MIQHDQSDTAKTDPPKITRGAEDVADQESEAGATDLGTDTATGRPDLAARRRAT